MIIGMEIIVAAAAVDMIGKGGRIENVIPGIAIHEVNAAAAV